MRQLLDLSDREQAHLATKLQTISEELPKLDENLKLLEVIKEATILSEDSLNAMNYAAILSTLRPATADKRFEEINDPVADTFAWILKVPEDLGDVQSKVSLELMEWLKAGSGVFHIAGKPGCGKSTLMKYLAAHGTTRDFLQQWASTDGKQLIFSGFFFWKLGTDEQKTMRGLLRGVLYNILKKNPKIAKLVFPEHWTPKRYALRLMAQTPGPSISDGQVKTAFDRLLNCEEIFAHFKICLFIDGLDEFDGPTESLWSFSSKLHNWTECDNVKNAEGVFLWVVLLLKWMEDELATGAASFQALQQLVETAPRELDEFFARILESIPKHHSRGAYFILAMMLRVRGYCIGRECSRDIPGVDDGFREPSIFGLSYIFDAFDSYRPGDGNRRIALPVPPCAHRSDYRDRQLQTVSRLQSWCKGLVEARESRGVRIAMFTHRSVPDFLSSALQDIAPKWNMDDNWIAEGILTICLAESKAQYITEHPHQDVITGRLGVTMESIARSTLLLPAPSTSRIFTLLDEIDATRQGLRHGALEGIGTVDPPRLFLGSQHNECDTIHGALSPVLAIATTAAVPLIGYVMWKLEDPQILNDSLSQLLMLTAVVDGTFRRHVECKFPDVSLIVRAVLASGISPNVGYPRFPQKKYQSFTFTEWLEYLASGQNDQVIDNKSPWRDTLSIFLSFIAFSDKGTVPDSIWNELQVWLQFGAEVPAEVLVITLPRDYQTAVGFRYPAEKAEVAMRSLPAHRNFKKAARMEYFRTFKSTTLSSMIRWHSPQNMDVLLKYTDPVSSLAEDPQEWKPPPYATCGFDEEDHRRERDRYFDSPRRHLKSGVNVWRFGLSWRTDLHEWVV
jgi:hypothetical protein